MSRRAPIFEDVPDEQWNDWRWQLSHRVNDLDEIEKILNLTPEERDGLSAPDKFRVDVTPYFISLIDPDDPNDPIRRQVIPLGREQEAFTAMMEDSLAEDRHSPVPGLVHRYPDRVLMLVTTQCASYCRYCTRSRIVGDPTQNFNSRDHEAQLEYLRRTPQVRDVLISGGDGLTLAPKLFEKILRGLREIPHIEIIRIGSRVPVFLPQRIDDELCEMLAEVPPAVDQPPLQPPERDHARGQPRGATSSARAGLPVGNQSVLLAGVNDCVHIQRALVHKLVANRIRPYYLYQCDLVEGSGHFRTPVGKGLEIMEGLRGHTSGYAVPTYVIDAPGGGGKIPVMPNYLISLLRPQGRAAQLRGLHHDVRGAASRTASTTRWPASTASTSGRSPASPGSWACWRASACGSSPRASRRPTRAATPRRTASRIRPSGCRSASGRSRGRRARGSRFSRRDGVKPRRPVRPRRGAPSARG